MSSSEEISNLILSTLQVFSKADLSKQEFEKIRLYGHGGVMESITLVSFLVTLEQKINQHFGSHIRLISDKALSQTSSPFLTTESLRQWVLLLLEEK